MTSREYLDAVSKLHNLSRRGSIGNEIIPRLFDPMNVVVSPDIGIHAALIRDAVLRGDIASVRGASLESATAGLNRALSDEGDDVVGLKEARERVEARLREDNASNGSDDDGSAATDRKKRTR